MPTMFHQYFLVVYRGHGGVHLDLDFVSLMGKIWRAAQVRRLKKKNWSYLYRSTRRDKTVVCITGGVILGAVFSPALWRKRSGATERRGALPRA